MESIYEYICYIEYHCIMIRNIIFDFGGVLMDLDFMLTVKGLTKTLDVDFKDKEYGHWFLELFKQFEKDAVTEESFLQQLSSRSNKRATTKEMIEAWNAMMIGLRKERFDMLKELKKDYGVYLLSNSNHIHYRAMLNMVNEMFGDIDFHGEFFHQAYYSQLLKMRKPDKEIFDHICTVNNLKKEETLFIDDLQANIDGAINAGLKAIRHDPKTEITEQFQAYITEANE